MSYDNTSNTSNNDDMPQKKKIQEQRDSIVEKVSNVKAADFETAITAAGTGKFQYLLLLAIIPGSWEANLDTANMSMILKPAECDLGLSLFDKGILNAAVYVGMVLSGFIWGYLADVKGRRKIILYGYIADGICNILAGFSPNFGTLLFFKFVSGFIVSGPYATLLAYCSEFYGAKGREKIPLLVGVSVALGSVVNAALAWLVIPRPWSIVLWDGAFVYNSWRIYLSMTGLPMLMGAICHYFFPESPKFLMAQDRNEDALEVFRKIYSINTGLPKDNYPICALENVNSNNSMEQLPSSKSQNTTKSLRDGIRQMKPIFSNPNLSRILLIIAIQFCGLAAVNVFRVWQPQLFATIENFKSFDTNISNPTFCNMLDFSTFFRDNKTVALEEVSTCENIVADSVYIDTVIISFSACVCILCGSIFVKYIQHKYLLIITYGCSLLCGVSLIWSIDKLTILVLTCLYLGLLSKAFNVVVGATVLLFPTSLRAMAVSVQMLVGRFGIMIGNLIFPILLENGCITTIVTLTCINLLCMILSCFIPSTRKHAM